MFDDLKKNLEGIDLSDFRLMIAGVLLLLLPLFYLVFFAGRIDETQTTTRIAITEMGKQSAFNLTSISKTPGAAGSRGAIPAITPKVEQVESELDRAWQKIQATPRVITLPPDIPVETRQMVEAEDDPDICEANSCSTDASLPLPKSIIEAISDAGRITLKNFCLGGLMEIYQLQGDRNKFREAFANYAKTAQKLQHVYGPLADNVARAYQMFEQIEKIDSGKLREYLTRANLEAGTKTSYEEFINSIKATKEWFPGNLPDPPATIPEMMQPGNGG